MDRALHYYVHLVLLLIGLAQIVVPEATSTTLPLGFDLPFLPDVEDKATLPDEGVGGFPSPLSPPSPPNPRPRQPEEDEAPEDDEDDVDEAKGGPAGLKPLPLPPLRPQSPPGPIGRDRMDSTTRAPFKTSPPTEYRLMNNQKNPSLGRVEVYYKDKWQPLCTNYRWNNKDARVLCRQLGYNTGVTTSANHFPKAPAQNSTDVRDQRRRGFPGPGRPRPAPGPPMTQETEKVKVVFHCTGDEEGLGSCPGNWVDYCYREVGAICYSQEINRTGIDAVRLRTPIGGAPVTGKIALGTVEVLHRGIWGTVCDMKFKEVAAMSVCRKLGYRYGYKVARNVIQRSGNNNVNNPMYWLGDFNCPRITERLLDCTSHRPGEFNQGCNSHYYDAVVMCLNTSKPFAELYIQNVRLTNTTRGRNWVFGQVEIQVDGVWGTACDKQRYSRSFWSNSLAATFCRQLGYMDGMYLSSQVFGKNRQQVWFYNRDCPIGAKSLRECEGQRFNAYDCKESGPGALCIGKGVVDDCIDRSDAKPSIPPFERRFGSMPGAEGTTGAWPMKVAPPASTTTRPERVKCKTRLRLVDNPDVPENLRGQSGRVEYYYRGLWGPFCATSFDDREAHVICKTLGFKSGRAMLNSSFGDGDGPIWLNNLNCAGNEASIKQCLNRGNSILRYPACPAKHHAGVLCESQVEQDVQVTLLGNEKGSGKNYLGIVAVLYSGHWGTICSNGWDDDDAKVVCRQLGYRNGFATTNNTQRGVSMPVWLEGVQCSGDEEKLMDCQHSGWAKKSMYALCDHSQVAGVLCINRIKEEKNVNGQNKYSPQNFLTDTAVAKTKDGGAAGTFYSSVLLILCAALTTIFSKME